MVKGKVASTSAKVAVNKRVKSGTDIRASDSDSMLEELLEAGAHLGHRAERWNPKIAPYIFDVREGVHIFDLEKTRDGLIAACDAIRARIASGKVVLLVGTKTQAKGVIVDVAKKTGMPYVGERWIGGFLTNFPQIKRSIDKLHKMKEEREAGEYKKFTKKEQLLIDRQIARFEKVLGGMAMVKEVPDSIFIVDLVRERTALAEAIKLGLTTFAIVDTNTDPTHIDYPIPANDDSVKAVLYIVEKFGEAIESGKSQASSIKSQTSPNDQNVLNI